MLTLSPPLADLDGLLQSLAVALGTMVAEDVAPPQSGPITPKTPAGVVAHAMPANAIIVHESTTSGVHLFPACAGAGPHDWINNRGGSIGYSDRGRALDAASCVRRSQGLAKASLRSPRAPKALAA
ncbi:hypothetical protein [Frigidibacter sp.]|uniref:hypothetical protein n=1 Tax=Frigidibacter sp. TaxID=2586418 RepID=UPI002735DD9B|nr:hypothetical protein [Frigidibacter sp.]MDP3339273.1 hypothetical protein [Frigidibacter sp.]